ncbi:MAG TPA: hypothetical protein VGG03_03965 [Thermoanaerobaculia bacterium]|jgi:hypothetical protein
MRRPCFAAVLILALLALSSLAAWAATASFTPPAEEGTIFTVINSNRGAGAIATSVSVSWGPFRKSAIVGNQYGNCARSSTAGFVLMIRHLRPESTFPFTVSTSGTIVRAPYQGIAPPEVGHPCYKLVKFRTQL